MHWCPWKETWSGAQPVPGKGMISEGEADTVSAKHAFEKLSQERRQAEKETERTKGQRGHAKLYLQTDPSQGLLVHIFNYKLVLSTWVACL